MMSQLLATGSLLAIVVAMGGCSQGAGGTGQTAETGPRIIYSAEFGSTINPLPAPPGDLELVITDLPIGAAGGAARAVRRPGGKGKWLRLKIDPPKAVGETTLLTFRYYVRGAAEMTVQVFDATDQDNRHVVLRGLAQNSWQAAAVNFTRDGRKNDGNQTPFAAGHLVDDLFFFVDAAPGGEVELMIDEVVLLDAGRDGRQGEGSGKNE
jgi:hypothetical protein